MILDTSFLVGLLDADQGAIRRARELEDDGVVRKAPAMAVLELYVGVGKVARSEREERRVRRVVDSLTVVEMDERVAIRAGRVVGELLGDGLPLGKGDPAIGATALIESEPVLTRNVDGFRRIPNLDVETY
ncbi:PIN domain-containing protein [Halobium palmae]|uniref:Ribonuclease VapC n=1 Tax=Halobium palmae TaxID=1776492 RepID=A0ABD5RXV5_9EURY